MAYYNNLLQFINYKRANDQKLNSCTKGSIVFNNGVKNQGLKTEWDVGMKMPCDTLQWPIISIQTYSLNDLRNIVGWYRCQADMLFNLLWKTLYKAICAVHRRAKSLWTASVGWIMHKFNIQPWHWRGLMCIHVRAPPSHGLLSADYFYQETQVFVRCANIGSTRAKGAQKQNNSGVNKASGCIFETIREPKLPCAWNENYQISTRCYYSPFSSENMGCVRKKPPIRRRGGFGKHLRFQSISS